MLFSFAIAAWHVHPARDRRPEFGVATARRCPILRGMNIRLLLLSIVFAASSAGAAPIALHPDNPHVFLFRERPTVLITSGEHYGAVLNLDFDYVKYLDTLAADGLNLTRTFTGAYIEPQGAFNIAENTLAPKAGRFISPWARSGQADKFDLTKWDPAYFSRLKDFVAQAGKRGIVVELALFCPMYEDMQWKLSPMNAANNINGIGAIGRNDVHTLDRNGGLLPVQEALVRKIVAELHDAENLCYEICNEPYFGGVTMAWQHHIADVITDAEKDFAYKHLITQNIATAPRRSKSRTRLSPCSTSTTQIRPPQWRSTTGSTKSSATTRPASKGRRTGITGWKRGSSSSRAAGSTTTSTTHSPPGTRTAHSSIHRSSPAAATPASASK